MERVAHIWGTIQGYLFPYLEEELGPLTDKLKQLVSILEMARIEVLSVLRIIKGADSLRNGTR